MISSNLITVAYKLLAYKKKSCTLVKAYFACSLLHQNIDFAFIFI